MTSPDLDSLELRNSLLVECIQRLRSENARLQKELRVVEARVGNCMEAIRAGKEYLGRALVAERLLAEMLEDRGP